MKVSNQQEFTPISVTFETMEEFVAFTQLVKVAWSETHSDSPASNLCEEIANALGFDVAN
jgi:CHASE1-domain containing sensor protein